MLDAAAGDPRLDANNWAMIWSGDISPSGGYVQSRLIGRGDGLMVYVQVMNPSTAGTLNLTINGRSFPIAYGSGNGWEYATRGERGWTAYRTIPWSELGGAPSIGNTWNLSQTAYGKSWTGFMHWGLPDYSGVVVPGTQVVTTSLSADATTGGGTECGSDDWPSYYPTWGLRNEDGATATSQRTQMGLTSQVNVGQAQWDTADWPCYSRYYAMWDLPTLPAGARVVSATVTMRHFGNPGYGGGYADDGTKDTVYQVYEINQPWTELGITWDNAPDPVEALSRTTVLPIDITCTTSSWFCSPGVPYTFDVTEIVKRAQLDGRSWASMALYTAAGQYHSGKYFWSREGSEPPVVTIAYYVPSVLVAPTPGPTATSTSTIPPVTPTAPTATPPAPTATPSAPTATPTALPAITATPAPAAAAGCKYYVAIGGKDSNAGTTLATAWATFRRAWDSLYPGDTLCIGDGIYTEPIQPVIRNGEPGKPITIKAINDGRVTIDGQGKNIPVRLGENWGPNGPIGDWFVVEGIVARNGTIATLRIEHGNNNVLRRVSAYDASVDENSQVIAIVWGDNNLIEDFIAAGTGRYMVNVYDSNNNTIRRGFTMWRQWDGRKFCGVAWPNGQNVGVYNSSNTTVENVLAYGRALIGIFVQANDIAAKAVNNHVLGSVAVLTGRDYDNSYWMYGAGQAQPTSRPQPITNPYGDPCPDNITQWEWGGQRTGFDMYGQGLFKDNLFKDVIAADNEGIGLHIGRVYLAGSPGWSNNRYEACTAYGNGRSLASFEQSWNNPLGPNAYNNSNGGATFAANCNIQGTPYLGPGAQIVRYVNRVRTGESVLPWPMQSRIMSELGIDGESLWRKYGGVK